MHTAEQTQAGRMVIALISTAGARMAPRGNNIMRITTIFLRPIKLPPEASLPQPRRTLAAFLINISRFTRVR